MLILFFGCVLCGAVLGRYFRFLILVVANGLVTVFVLVSPEMVSHSLLGFFLEIVVLFTALQFGYLVGVVTRYRGLRPLLPYSVLNSDRIG
jgi:hypothetical protein